LFFCGRLIIAPTVLTDILVLINAGHGLIRAVLLTPLGIKSRETGESFRYNKAAGQEERIWTG